MTDIINVTPPSTDARIAAARSRLAGNLAELQQRVSQAREAVSSETIPYLSSPWLKVAAGVVVVSIVANVALAGFLVTRMFTKTR